MTRFSTFCIVFLCAVDCTLRVAVAESSLAALYMQFKNNVAISFISKAIYISATSDFFYAPNCHV